MWALKSGEFNMIKDKWIFQKVQGSYQQDVCVDDNMPHYHNRRRSICVTKYRTDREVYIK